MVLTTVPPGMNVGAVGTVGKMQTLRRDLGTRRNEELGVFDKRAAGAGSQGRVQVQTSLRVRVVDIASGQQTVALRSDVCDRKNDVAANSR